MEAVFRIGQATILEVRGRDRCKVLNNQATQDLRTFGEGQAAETFITDPKGKAFGHGIAIGLPDSLWFVTVPDQGERLIPHLDRYIIMEDASLHDLSSQFELWLSSSNEWLASFCGNKLPDQGSYRVPMQQGIAIAFHAPWISPKSVLLATDSLATSNLLEKLDSSQWIASDLKLRKEWESERIANFWPWYGQDCDERNLPQELDRDATAISFNKGCYLGQETIARLDALGQVQKKLVKVEFESRLPLEMISHLPVTLHCEDLEIGSLRSIGKRHDGKYLGLAFVKRSHFSAGSQLTAGDSKEPCRITE